MAGDCFGHGIDDTHIKIRGAPVLDEPALESHQKMIADKLTVSELMTMAICALPPVVKVLLQLLTSSSLHGRLFSNCDGITHILIFKVRNALREVDNAPCN